MYKNKLFRPMIYFGIFAESTESTHTALEESGTENVAVCKAPVSILITILI